LSADHPWLTFICPACQQIGEIDLRRMDRHPNATIESMILSLSCRRTIFTAFVPLVPTAYVAWRR
jgi:hypothetical protein